MLNFNRYNYMLMKLKLYKMMDHVYNSFIYAFLSGYQRPLHKIMSKSTVLTKVQKLVHEIMSISTVFTKVQVDKKSKDEVQK